MSPHTQPHHRGVHVPNGIVRRSSALLVAALVIGGTPLVARALGDELVAQSADAPAPSGPARRFGDWPVRPSSPILDLGVDLDVAPDREAETATETTVPEPAVVPQAAMPIEVPLAPVLPFGTEESQWAALRQCEAGGNYAITNPSGKYRGAYQFDRSTWNSIAERHAPLLVGVDPAAASPADQDTVAFALYSERGARPWPHCGRHLP